LDIMELPVNYYKGRGPAMYFDFIDNGPTLVIPEFIILTENRIQVIDSEGASLVDTTATTHH